MRDAFGDGPVTAGEAHRFGAPPLDEVAGVEAREVGLLERGEDEIVQLVEAGPVPRLEPAEGEGEQVQGPGAFGPVEVRGEREHPLLVEAVDPLGGGAQQARVAHQQRDLLLGGGPEVEPSCQPAGEVDGLGVLAGRVENERREQQPLGMLQSRVFGLRRARRSRRDRGSCRRARIAARATGRSGTDRRGGGGRPRPAREARARARPSSRGTATFGRRRCAAPRRAAAMRRGPIASACRRDRRGSRAALRPGCTPPRLIVCAASSASESARPSGGDPGEIDYPVARHQPASAGRRRTRVPSLGSSGADLLESPAQERRRDQRRGQHDEQQRRVLILVEDASRAARSSRRSARPHRAGSCPGR